MRLRLGVALLLAVVVCATAGTARAGTALIVTGHGWGHGVGMSQWGAYGYALHGWKYRRILGHYYPGTTMGHVGEQRVRVLLAQGASSVTVGCAAPLVVTDGRRLTRKLPAGTYGVGSRLVFPVRRHGAGFSFGHVAVLSCARAPLTFDGREYHGTLVLRSQGWRRLGRQRPLARHLPPRRRPLGVAVALASRRAGSAGGRRPLVRRRAAEAELLVRPRADHARPGLRRGRGRAAALRSRGLHDARPDPDLGRPGRADVLLLELRRPHRVRAGRVARLDADPVPALGAGSVRHVLPAPQLGAVQLLRGAAGGAARPRQRRRVGERGARREPARRVGRVPPGVRCRGDPQRSAGDEAARPPVDVVLDRAALALVEQRSRAVREHRHARRASSGRAGRGAAAAERRRRLAAVRNVKHPTQLHLQPPASTTFRLVAPGTNGTTVSVAVAPRVQVHAPSPSLLVGEVSPRPTAPSRCGVSSAVVARRLAPDPQERHVPDAVAAPPGRLPDHRRRRRVRSGAAAPRRYAPHARRPGAVRSVTRYVEATREEKRDRVDREPPQRARARDRDAEDDGHGVGCPAVVASTAQRGSSVVSSSATLHRIVDAARRSRRLGDTSGRHGFVATDHRVEIAGSAPTAARSTVCRCASPCPRRRSCARGLRGRQDHGRRL